MKYLINTTYLSDSQKRNENVELSSSCPCCGVSLFPDLLYAVCVDHDDMEEDIVYTFNHCQNCDECFISKHPFDAFITFIDADLAYEAALKLVTP